MTRHTPPAIRRLTREEKAPPPHPLTRLRQPLQIKHLPKRHPPQRQDRLVQQHLPLHARPRLKCRRVARHRGEIAVVQPVQHGVFLGHACEAGPSPLREKRAFRRGLAVVGGDEAAADEQDVADLDAAALGGGSDVKALGGSTGSEVGVGDRMAAVGVWTDD